MAEAQSLEERLKEHAEAFNGLLSLIPAKTYYGEDTSDQWRRKKQTKAEARAAKIAKLDPDNNKSALDVIQENERKRKREEEAQQDQDSEGEQPLEGLKAPKSAKKHKNDLDSTKTQAEVDSEAISAAKRDKKKQKREGKKARKQAAQAKQQVKKERRQQARALSAEDGAEVKDAEDGEDKGSVDMEPLDATGLEEMDGHRDKEVGAVAPAAAPEQDWDQVSSSATPTTKADSPAFDSLAQPSGTSSISSVTTTEPSIPLAGQKSKDPPLEHTPDLTSQATSRPLPAGSSLSMEEKQERLRKRIEQLRAARKADIDGAPAKSRTELLASRRKKQDQRKERKKALRQQAKEEEERQREDSMARGSPLMSPSIRSPPNEVSNNFAFGRITFENGEAMTADLSRTLDLSKKKGRSDPKTALLAVNAKEDRLAGLDSAKRTEIAEKDMWLNARKRAQGDRIRDESSLLKKALKRKEKQKEKSTNEWNKRIEGVKLGKEAKQRKREDNLAKRKEEKGKGKGAKGAKAKKSKKRPGFEGSFKAGRKK